MELRTPSGAFLEVAKTWHEDPETNKCCGFGPGQAGVREAQATLEATILNPPAGSSFLSVWEETEPIGYVLFTDLEPVNKRGDLHITLSPARQGQGLGASVLEEAVAMGFREGLYRITFCPMVWNKRAIEAALKAGFKIEARTKASIWTTDGPQDQAQMRVIKPEWERRRS